MRVCPAEPCARAVPHAMQRGLSQAARFRGRFHPFQSGSRVVQGHGWGWDAQSKALTTSSTACAARPAKDKSAPIDATGDPKARCRREWGVCR